MNYRRGRLVVRLFNGSMPAPCCNYIEASMTEDNEEREEVLKPVRINYIGVEMPKPSQKNLRALALKAWLDYSAQMEMILDHDMPTWDELPEPIQDVWLRVARGQHAILTLLGGGEIEQIEPTDAE